MSTHAQYTQRPPRHDAGALVEKLFSALDTQGQGYLEEAGFSSALESVTGSSDAAALFKELDADSDGKLTESEFSSSLQALSAQLDQQFMNMRLQGAMPPPPPPGNGSDQGFSKDELQNQLAEISSQGNGDTRRSELISKVLENFSAADTDGNGKVSFAEAMALQKNTGSTNGTSTTSSPNAASTTGATASTSAAGVAGTERRWMQQLVQLLNAYGLQPGDAGGTLRVQA